MFHQLNIQEENLLLARAQAGDREALARLLVLYGSQAYRVALGIVHNHHDAEDVMQESHLNAFRHLAQFRGDSRFATWLMKIVARQAVTALRRRSRRREVSLENVLEAEDERLTWQLDVDPGEDPEVRALKEEMRRILGAAIEKLDPPCRVVFVMRELAGFSIEEIASAAEVSISAVKARLFRGRRKLHRWMLRRMGGSGNQSLLVPADY